MGRNTLSYKTNIEYERGDCDPSKSRNASLPGGRHILTDEEMEEIWRRIDEKKLDKARQS